MPKGIKNKTWPLNFVFLLLLLFASAPHQHHHHQHRHRHHQTSTSSSSSFFFSLTKAKKLKKSLLQGFSTKPLYPLPHRMFNFEYDIDTEGAPANVELGIMRRIWNYQVCWSFSSIVKFVNSTKWSLNLSGVGFEFLFFEWGDIHFQQSGFLICRAAVLIEFLIHRVSYFEI